MKDEMLRGEFLATYGEVDCYITWEAAFYLEANLIWEATPNPDDPLIRHGEWSLSIYKEEINERVYQMFVDARIEAGYLTLLRWRPRDAG